MKDHQSSKVALLRFAYCKVRWNVDYPISKYRIQKDLTNCCNIEGNESNSPAKH